MWQDLYDLIQYATLLCILGIACYTVALVVAVTELLVLLWGCVCWVYGKVRGYFRGGI